MAFVNISLLLGSALMAIPIVVHLTMRRKPQRQVFPALRFLQERRDSNRRKLELRHWLLLALRCGLIGILAMALARPSVDAPQFGRSLLIGLTVAAVLLTSSILVIALRQRVGRLAIGILGSTCCLLVLLLLVLLVPALGRQAKRTIGSKRAPVAAALVVDTSARMEYRFENQTRIEQVRQTALWLLDQLPEGSQVAVLETRPGPSVFSVDSSAARQAIERLQSSALAESLVAAALRGVELLQTSPLERKELYLFGDLAQPAWPSDAASLLQSAVSEQPDLTCYVIDHGVERPTNSSLGDLSLSAERAVIGSELLISTQITHVGDTKKAEVELRLEAEQADRPLVVDGEILLPDSVLRDQAIIDLTSERTQQVEFRLRGLSKGIHHGSVRIKGADSLAADDIRHFTIDIAEAWPILVVAPANVSPSLFVEAIAPHAFQQIGRAEFACRIIEQGELERAELSRFAAVCLLDPSPLTDTAGQKLSDYVATGGSLALFLGHNAQPPEQFSRSPMHELMGGQLVDRWRSSGRELYLAPSRFDHPLLSSFRSHASRVPWRDSPVFRHWMLGSMSDEAAVVVLFTNGKPALLENRFHDGRVITLTTPVTDPLAPRGRATWNELPTSENAWPYLILANETMKYLVNRDDSRLNFRPGEVVALPNDPDHDPLRYRLFAPGQESFDIAAQDKKVVVRFTERPGIYRLKGRRESSVVRGFSVNTPAAMFNLARIDPTGLAKFLPADRYHYATQRSEITARIGQARMGREFYPYLMVALVLVVGLEHLLANRFYRGPA